MAHGSALRAINTTRNTHNGKYTRELLAVLSKKGFALLNLPLSREMNVPSCVVKGLGDGVGGLIEVEEQMNFHISSLLH